MNLVQNRKKFNDAIITLVLLGLLVSLIGMNVGSFSASAEVLPISNDYALLKTVELPNNEKYAYREKGKGMTTLVLVHGNLSSSLHWDLLSERLSESDYRIIAPDLRGFGDSSYKQPISSIKDFSDDLKLFVDALGLGRFTLIGWSLGGLVSEQFAADYPEHLSNLVLVASTLKTVPTPKYDEKGQIVPNRFLTTRDEIESAVEFTLQAINNRDYTSMQFGLDMAVYPKIKPEPERYKQYLDVIFQQRNFVDVNYALLSFNISKGHNGLMDGTSEVDNIICPTLVIHGDSDLVVPLEYGINVAEEIGDNAKMVILADTGHSPFTDSLETFVAELKSFIDQ